jgi:ABC-2 type transport system permease protein
MLSRDPGALIILFLMPVALVFIVSLIQGNVYKFMEMGESISILVADDDGPVSVRIIDTLERMTRYTVLRSIDGEPVSPETAETLVAAGRYRCAVIFPAGLSEVVLATAQEDAAATLRGRNEEEKDGEDSETEGDLTGVIQIRFDPALGGPFRSAFIASVNLAVMKVEVDIRSDAIRALIPRISLEWTDHRLITITDLTTASETDSDADSSAVGSSQPARTIPTTAEQNVPAWTLFGMFFIVLPLSGVIIRERDYGTLDRLRTLRVPLAALVVGKFGAYTLVCLLQFVFMATVGIYLLPLATAEPLSFPSSLAAVAIMAVASAFAAVGFGMLVGSAAKSYEQASTAGALSVVIAAAVGGLMVPGYLMPDALQILRRLSPLSWGLDGFLNIFIRNGTVASILPNAAVLTGFAALTCLAAISVLYRRHIRR